jgi:hypothetical protein
VVHAERFCNELFAPKLAHLSDIFEKFSILNPSMQ